jgi:hypothetical protein
MRWPNPIEASFAVGAPCNAWPRLPFQIADFLQRPARFVAAAVASAVREA